MPLSNAERDLVLEELRTQPNHAIVARKLQVSAKTVRDIDIEQRGRYSVSDDGMGRKELRDYIVARKHVDQPWPRKDPAILGAQEAYDRGEVEITSGRDGFWIILYAIPREEIDVNRRPYFSAEFGGL